MDRSYAFLICCLGLVVIGLISASVGTETWAEMTITSNTTCVVSRVLGLFNSRETYSSDCFYDDSPRYSTLSSPEVDIETALIYIEIICCIITILSAIIAAAVAGYNLCARPFETWAGPYGLLSYFICAFTFNLAAVIFFVVAGYVEISDTVPEDCSKIGRPLCKNEGYAQDSWSFGYSFYILVGALAACILGVVIVLMSDREISKKIKGKCCPSPSEVEEISKPKDGNIMMY